MKCLKVRREENAECGKGLPEVQFMIPLCNLLGINVNEVLSGKKISADEYQQKAEGGRNLGKQQKNAT